MTAYNYDIQRMSNILAFLTDPVYGERLEILKKISTAFEENGVSWALSCSTALFFRGILDDFHDYDVLVSQKDTQRAKEILSDCGLVLNPNTPQKNTFFCSPDYVQASCGNVEFDIITDIALKTFGGKYTYKVEQGVEPVSLDGNVLIPLIPVEAQMVLYGMMEGWQAKRRFKRDLCWQYLQEMRKIQSPLRYQGILTDAMEQQIPDFLREVINSLLI